MIGKEIDEERLCEIFFELEEKGAHNINLVTATHFIPSIKIAIEMAKNKGIKIPFVYNTSGYEKVDSLKMLEGLIDIYLPDFKYIDSERAKKYSRAEKYPTIVKVAIEEMVRQCRTPQFNQDGTMKKGVIVRHLVLPEGVEDSKSVINYLYQTYKDDIYISIMNQYTPVLKSLDFPELHRKVTEKEYDQVIDFAIEIGVENGFLQDKGTVSESFIPKWTLKGVKKKEA